MISGEYSTRSSHPRTKLRWIVGLVLLIHAILVAWIAFHHSANRQEPAHLAAGIYTLRYGRFEVYRVNPPLAHVIAAVPATWLFRIDADWLPSTRVLCHRSEFPIGYSIFDRNSPRTVFYAFALGRIMLLPFSLLGAWTCHRWAQELFGRSSGFAALLLWCFSPMILAFAATASPDLASAALGVFGFFHFWKWCRKPTWNRALAAGLCGGLLLLSKTTFLIVFLLWPLVASLYLQLGARHRLRDIGTWLSQLVSILVLAVLVANAGYGFSGSGRQLGSFTFLSRTLAGQSIKDGQGGGNRFAASWLGFLPVPFPEDYVIGIDLQKYDFESGSPSYLRGQWADRGWWYYYMYGMAIKMPLGTWCLATLAVVTTMCCRGSSSSWRNEVFVLFPFFAILVLVSSQTGLSEHTRYILPALPYLFIWVSKVARAFQARPRFRRHQVQASITTFALAWTISSSLAVYPHSLSYFNELVGGPKCGPIHLLGSNVDWGQDLYYLERWYKGQQHVRPFGLKYTNAATIGTCTIPFDRVPPTCSTVDGESKGLFAVAAFIEPGWYALSVNDLYARSAEYRYFLRYEPIAMAGYSVYIYHLKHEDIDRIRRKCGLPSLKTEEESRERLIVRLTAHGKSRDRPGRVALFEDSGVSEICLTAVESELSSGGFICTTLGGKDVREGALDSMDVVVFPGGRATEQWEALESEGAKAVRGFVSSGGGYLGICAGASLAAANQDRNCLNLLNAEYVFGTRRVPRLGTRKVHTLGAGMVNVALTARGQTVFDNCQVTMRMLYSGGPVFVPGNSRHLPRFTRLAVFRSEVFLYGFQRGDMIGSPAMIVAPYGNGVVLLISPHPELTPGSEHVVSKSVEILANCRPEEARD